MKIEYADLNSTHGAISTISVPSNATVLNAVRSIMHEPQLAVLMPENPLIYVPRKFLTVRVADEHLPDEVVRFVGYLEGTRLAEEIYIFEITA